MTLTPFEILKFYENKEIDKKNASKLVISLIEDSDDDDLFEEGIEILEKIAWKNEAVYRFLENVLISDSNINARNAAFYALKAIFPERICNPLTHLVEYDNSFLFINFIEHLTEIDLKKCKEALIKRIKRERNTISNLIFSYDDFFEIEDLSKIKIERLIGMYKEFFYYKCVNSLFYRRIDGID